MDLIFVGLLFIVGLLLVVKGAGFLVDGASSIARKLKISELVIGLTIVAFGTSMPELTVNIFASINGETDIAIGNILGSNIANILLILGASALIFPLKVTRGTVWKEIPLSLLAVLVLGLMANDILIDKASTSVLSRIDGLVFIGFFIIFLYYTFGIAKIDAGENEEDKQKEYSSLVSAGLILAGLVALILGGKLVVDSAISFATALGVSSSLIGLTVVAIGTSVPELATSIVAAMKKKADIAVGNVVGSNIFNVFWILGLSAVIKPLNFQGAANFDILTVIVASALLFIFMFIGKRHILERWQGALFLLLYAGYLTAVVIKG